IAASQRGVDVHVVLLAGSHDTTWMLQQHLESSGLDVDVRSSAVTGVTMVADSKSLHGAKIISTASTVAADRARFDMAGSEPTKGTLLSSGVKVLAMPDATRDRIVQLFDAARSTIDLEIYQVQERRVVKALEDAAGRGVTVRVMLEPKTVGAANYTQMSA